MRSKKGFTLIELLAVIVILAVIALIATPIIMNVINDSKEGAAKDSMYGYIKAVELASIDAVTALTDAPDGKYVPENGNLKQGSEVLEVAFKGTKPKDNTGEVILSKGNVVEATLEFDGITVHYDGKKAEVGGSSTPTPKTTFELGEVVYYNPETNTKCSSNEVNSTSTAKTGCLKWNVVTMGDNNSKTTIDIMINHNTTAYVAWNSSNDNTQGMKEATASLTNDVSSWDATIKNSARLISAQEIGDMVEVPDWYDKFPSLAKYPWLYQNLSVENTEAAPNGYWTDTANTYDIRYAWCVYYKGKLASDDVTVITIAKNNYYGIRPVITVRKSTIA